MTYTTFNKDGVEVTVDTITGEIINEHTDNMESKETADHINNALSKQSKMSKLLRKAQEAIIEDLDKEILDITNVPTDEIDPDGWNKARYTEAGFRLLHTAAGSYVGATVGVSVLGKASVALVSVIVFEMASRPLRKTIYNKLIQIH